MSLMFYILLVVSGAGPLLDLWHKNCHRITNSATYKTLKSLEGTCNYLDEVTHPVWCSSESGKYIYASVKGLGSFSLDYKNVEHSILHGSVVFDTNKCDEAILIAIYFHTASLKYTDYEHLKLSEFIDYFSGNKLLIINPFVEYQINGNNGEWTNSDDLDNFNAPIRNIIRPRILDDDDVSVGSIVTIEEEFRAPDPIRLERLIDIDVVEPIANIVQAELIQAQIVANVNIGHQNNVNNRRINNRNRIPQDLFRLLNNNRENDIVDVGIVQLQYNEIVANNHELRRQLAQGFLPRNLLDVNRILARGLPQIPPPVARLPLHNNNENQNNNGVDNVNNENIVLGNLNNNNNNNNNDVVNNNNNLMQEVAQPVLVINEYVLPQIIYVNSPSKDKHPEYSLIFKMYTYTKIQLFGHRVRILCMTFIVLFIIHMVINMYLFDITMYVYTPILIIGTYMLLYPNKDIRVAHDDDFDLHPHLYTPNFHDNLYDPWGDTDLLQFGYLSIARIQIYREMFIFLRDKNTSCTQSTERAKLMTYLASNWYIEKKYIQPMDWRLMINTVKHTCVIVDIYQKRLFRELGANSSGVASVTL